MNLLLSPRFLPTVMIVLQAGAAIRWGIAWRAGAGGNPAGQTIYWISAVGITFAVTYLMGKAAV